MTPNQTVLLRAVCRRPLTTAELAVSPNAAGAPFGENAARNAMNRMETAGLVAGDGKGRSRVWTPTEVGRREIGGEVETALRRYVVLEEVTLAQAVREAAGALLEEDSLNVAVADLLAVLADSTVYDPVIDVTARNTEHAYRQAAKTAFASDTVDHEPTLVAVAEKQWRPVAVRIQTRQTVSVG